ncbi:MAG: tRNA pseudouridine(38-40) synthase TruA [Dehalococcoidales bacterium]|nr:tRNA pseudouridine(38-40) synthase TruA [Dehalococcoidales bacterium]
MVITAVKAESEPVVSLAATTRIVLVVEYDGTRYFGFQLQADLPTIQGNIEEALEKLTGEKIRLIAASRTDTGVHARGQVVSFRTKSAHSVPTFVKGLNYYLPADIAVKAAHRVRDQFNVRRHAVSREYRYTILNSETRSPLIAGFSYRVVGHLDIGIMNQACQALIGQHDFASFTSGVDLGLKSTVRRVNQARVSRDGELVIFEIAASSFLPHQVRNTVGALVRVGQGKMSVEEFCSIMGARKPGLAGPTVPAGGLSLMQVNYTHPFEEEI